MSDDKNIFKKGVHFNLANKEDKEIVDFLIDNNINFSSLTKQLMMIYIHEQVMTVSSVEKIARKEVNEILASKFTEEVFQNQIRKILLEMMQNPNMSGLTVSSNIKEDVQEDLKGENEEIINKAVSSYTVSDLAAMSSFSDSD